MRNLRELIVLVFSILSFFRVNAQCPVSNFSASDTVCPLQNMTIDNSSSTATGFNWDFCLGDLDSIPTGAVIPGMSSTLVYPQNMKLVEENGLYYGFFPNFGASYITRYDFGNSPANNPINIVNLASDPLLGNATIGLDMVKEGNKWYGFAVCYSSNTMLRLEFDSITQLNPVITNLNVTGLASPNSIKIYNGYAFVPNYQSVEITRLSFGGSYTNTPTLFTPAINTGMFSNFGFDIAYDCVSGKYIGYSSNYGNGVLIKLDFQNSPANLPTVTTVATGLSTAQGLQLVQEKNNWHLFLVTNAPSLVNFGFGNSLDLQPVLNYTTTLGGIMADPKNIQLSRIGTNWVGLISNNLLWASVRVTFPQGCSGPAIGSTLQSPNNVNFGPGSTGYQYYELTESTNGGAATSYFDSVLVYLSPPEAAFSNSSACVNSAVQFSDNSSICFGALTGWNWDFGDGSFSTDANPIHKYQTTGSFTVNLTVTDSTGQTDTFSQAIHVSNIPDAWFSVPMSACAGSDVQLTDSSTANEGNLSIWTWDLGDTTSASSSAFTHAYSNPGSYTISMIVTTDLGCSDTTTRTINILPGPFSSFEIANTCIGETVSFNNTSIAPGTIIQSYAWDFGDGNTDNVQNPQHLYAQTVGQYIAQLICITTNGCADTISQLVKIGNKPLPYFTVSDDTACSFSVIQFTDASIPASGDTIIQRIWDFGDGTLDSTSLSPSHSYSAPGSYTIRLTTKSPVDCDSSYSYTLFIIESPTANFTVNNACFGNPHNFNDLSTAPSGSSINYWSWDFGNSATSNQSSVAYTYPDTGTYNVTLIVQSNIGCYDTLVTQAIVYKIPVANFTFPKICTNQLVTFTDSSTVEGSVISAWNWNFSTPGGISALQNPTTSFPDALAYPVTMIVSSAYGCSDTISKMAAVFQSPEYNINTPDHCFGKNQFMSVTVTSGNLANLSYLWNFGDSTASFLANPVHSYPLAGIYVADLQVTDVSNGCEVTVSDTINVHHLPAADFTTSGQCEGEPVSFTDSSNIVSGTINTWNWQLGTAGNSTQQNPATTFNNDGVQQIKLVVTSDFGCKDSITKSLTIQPKPLASFVSTPEYGAPPLDVDFTNTSDSGSYYWDFGDDSPIYNGNNPSHTYSDTGAYTATVTVISPFGCTNQYSNDIYVLIPHRDLAINGISYIKENNQWVMKAIVANFGNEDAYTFELKAQLNNEAVFYNTFDADTLKVGTFREYTFNTKLDALNDNAPAFFCAEVVNVNHQQDMNAANDRFCISSTTGFDIINIYPNPADNTLFLGIHSDISSEVLIEMYQSDGKRIREEKPYAIAKGLNTLSMDLSDLSSGLYVINIRFGDTEKSLRIVRK